MGLDEWKQIYKKMEKETLEAYLKFLRFQSISADPAFKNECRTCALWIVEFLKNIHFKVDLWETHGNPVIFASTQKNPNQPTLLLYHHYDVQPVDPLDLWKSPPFEPLKEGENIFARGAQDNKGQCLYTLMALKALYTKMGTYPINIKLCIEGEEEIGSPGLSQIVSSKQDDLSSDYLAIVDGGMRQKNSPEICLGVRGLVTMDVVAHGSKMDLHSGQHGGAIYNPIHALVEVLAKLRDPKTGKVAVPGFYDEVVEMSKEEKERFDFDFDNEEYIRLTGAPPTGGEKEFPPMERKWIRPTLEINGIQGGYAGEGFKTVIPAIASAKVSCRLVPKQDPEIIGKRVADHIRSLSPDGIKIETNIHDGFGKPARAKPGSPIVKAFEKAYQEIFQKKTKTSLAGGSIPITVSLAEASEADVVIVGMGLPSDAVHAPNEHFSLDRVENGFYSIARVVEILAGIG